MQDAIGNNGFIGVFLNSRFGFTGGESWLILGLFFMA